MSTRWDDYATQATTKWAELGLETDLLAFRAGIRLERIARAHEQMLNDALSPFRRRGVKGMEDFRLLALLTRLHPESSSTTAASRALGLSKAATSLRLDRFSQLELIERTTSDYDRRTVDVRASALGIDLARECVDTIAAAQAKFLSPLKPKQLEQLDDLLAELTPHV